MPICEKCNLDHYSSTTEDVGPAQYIVTASYGTHILGVVGMYVHEENAYTARDCLAENEISTILNVVRIATF